MKKYTFTAILVGDPEGKDPDLFVDVALLHGDKHSEFALYHDGEIKVEDAPDED